MDSLIKQNEERKARKLEEQRYLFLKENYYIKYKYIFLLKKRLAKTSTNTNSNTQIKSKQNALISYLRKFFNRAYIFAYKKMDFVIFLISIGVYFVLPARLDWEITSVKGFIKRNGGIKRDPMGQAGMRPY